MNIFYLHENPKQCAEWMVDKHVVKMILETAQLLSTAHRLLDGTQTTREVQVETGHFLEDLSWVHTGYKTKVKKYWELYDGREAILYSATHANHPSGIWARTSVQNYLWLVEHLFALGDEYTHRYGKKHATITKLGYQLQSPPGKLTDWDWTSMPSCMDVEYIISEDPITNYRNYYKYGKARMHSWKNREPPEWITD